MSVFKRANWKSGLTYRQTCPLCNTEITYKDDRLGFRPWFPDGFVYCPKCEKPLRHNEKYAIDRVEKVCVDLTGETKEAVVEESEQFCSQCGCKLDGDANFCPQCGTKR